MKRHLNTKKIYEKLDRLIAGKDWILGDCQL